MFVIHSEAEMEEKEKALRGRGAYSTFPLKDWKSGNGFSNMPFNNGWGSTLNQK